MYFFRRCCIPCRFAKCLSIGMSIKNVRVNINPSFIKNSSTPSYINRDTPSVIQIGNKIPKSFIKNSNISTPPFINKSHSNTPSLFINSNSSHPSLSNNSNSCSNHSVIHNSSSSYMNNSSNDSFISNSIQNDSFISNSIQNDSFISTSIQNHSFINSNSFLNNQTHINRNVNISSNTKLENPMLISMQNNAISYNAKSFMSGSEQTMFNQSRCNASPSEININPLKPNNRGKNPPTTLLVRPIPRYVVPIASKSNVIMDKTTSCCLTRESVIRPVQAKIQQMPGQKCADLLTGNPQCGFISSSMNFKKPSMYNHKKFDRGDRSKSLANFRKAIRNLQHCEELRTNWTGSLLNIPRSLTPSLSCGKISVIKTSESM